MSAALDHRDIEGWFRSATGNLLDPLRVSNGSQAEPLTPYALKDTIHIAVPGLLEFAGFHQLLRDMCEAAQREEAAREGIVVYGPWYDGRIIAPDRFAGLTGQERVMVLVQADPKLLRDAAFHVYYQHQAQMVLDGELQGVESNGIMKALYCDKTRRVLPEGLTNAAVRLAHETVERLSAGLWEEYRQKKKKDSSMPDIPSAVLGHAAVRMKAYGIFELEGRILDELARHFRKETGTIKIV